MPGVPADRPVVAEHHDAVRRNRGPGQVPQPGSAPGPGHQVAGHRYNALDQQLLHRAPRRELDNRDLPSPQPLRPADEQAVAGVQRRFHALALDLGNQVPGADPAQHRRRQQPAARQCGEPGSPHRTSW
ncbi:MAG: hypothetical protein JO345_24140 [Streptosporangiaceae bacterium]|nr:hypothetical protein [Streptosporangiaceae bacterium]